MKVYISLFSLISFILFISSCQQTTDSDSNSNMINKLYGSWALSEYEENAIIFNKTENFNTDEYAFSFKHNGIFIERKQSDCCGNDPNTFTNFNGQWKQLSESMFEITIEYIDWSEKYDMEVVSVNSSNLKVIYHLNN